MIQLYLFDKNLRHFNIQKKHSVLRTIFKFHVDFLFPHSCYIFSHPWFYRPNKIYRTEKYYLTFVMLFSPFLCHYSSLMSKYTLRYFVLKRPQHVFFLHGDTLHFAPVYQAVPITVAARFKTWTVFARSKAGIVGSNPTQGMDVCVCIYSVFVLSCV
jgi:hypothetical protein